jgi:hypothetical protein
VPPLSRDPAAAGDGPPTTLLVPPSRDPSAAGDAPPTSLLVRPSREEGASGDGPSTGAPVPSSRDVGAAGDGPPTSLLVPSRDLDPAGDTPASALVPPPGDLGASGGVAGWLGGGPALVGRWSGWAERSVVPRWGVVRVNTDGSRFPAPASGSSGSRWSSTAAGSTSSGTTCNQRSRCGVTGGSAIRLSCPIMTIRALLTRNGHHTVIDRNAAAG